MDTSWLKGIIATAVTPFDEREEVDETAFVEQVRYLVAAGVDGISVGGSTGEGAILSDEELSRLCVLAIAEVGGKVPVIAGIIRNCTRDALRTANAVVKTGVKALMVTPVHYHVLAPGDDGNYEFYRRIGKDIGLPIVIYNVIPHNVISPELLNKLSNIPQVVAIKQSGGDIHKLAEMVQKCGDRIVIMSAVDDLLFPTYMVGAQGSIVAPSAIIPELVVQQWQAFLRKDYEAAEELHRRILPVVQAISGVNFPGKIKEAIRQLGRTAGITRSPGHEPTEVEKETIRNALACAGVLDSSCESV
ncbi:dihydrodipicolinate synthase family protein [Alicyclobacillus dauci]|uniref:Dihydrodipicolinate synthase family protein n=1 Tax=Alicyclobacillus dauci TaxID=1475485 RepID=A0ABY6Z0L2_9BACL|nr:dihydrodipicolinate synthase family protein [Alicyclobacillus dauci]WAH35771.1 dihydrodipicolinate synthase family protein [Alicyclobacillus dauci]